MNWCCGLLRAPARALARLAPLLRSRAAALLRRLPALVCSRAVQLDLRGAPRSPPRRLNRTVLELPGLPRPPLRLPLRLVLRLLRPRYRSRQRSLLSSRLRRRTLFQRSGRGGTKRLGMCPLLCRCRHRLCHWLLLGLRWLRLLRRRREGGLRLRREAGLARISRNQRPRGGEIVLGRG